MSNYTKTVNFTAKDSLPSGTAAKIVKGAEIDTEFDNIAVAVATKIQSGDTVAALTITAATIGTATVTSYSGTIDGGTY